MTKGKPRNFLKKLRQHRSIRGNFGGNLQFTKTVYLYIKGLQAIVRLTLSFFYG